MSLSATLERGVKASWEVYLSVRLSIPWNCTIRQLIAAAGREEGGISAARLGLLDGLEGGRERRQGIKRREGRMRMGDWSGVKD